jgi:hypothetical protein
MIGMFRSDCRNCIPGSLCGTRRKAPGADLAGLAALLAILTAGALIGVVGLKVAIFDADWVSKRGNIEAAYAM